MFERVTVLAYEVGAVVVDDERPAGILRRGFANQAERVGLGVGRQIGVPRAGAECSTERRIERRAKDQRGGDEGLERQIVGDRLGIADDAHGAAAAGVGIGHHQIVFDRVARPDRQAAADVLALDVTDALVIEKVELETVATLEIARDAQQ